MMHYMMYKYTVFSIQMCCRNHTNGKVLNWGLFLYGRTCIFRLLIEYQPFRNSYVNNCRYINYSNLYTEFFHKVTGYSDNESLWANTTNPWFKPRGLINFMVHNHLGSNWNLGCIQGNTIPTRFMVYYYECTPYTWMSTDMPVIQSIHGL